MYRGRVFHYFRTLIIVNDPVDQGYFQGRENTLKISRVYSTEWLCSYEMINYPFDTQVCFSFFTYFDGHTSCMTLSVVSVELSAQLIFEVLSHDIYTSGNLQDLHAAPQHESCVLRPCGADTILREVIDVDKKD